MVRSIHVVLLILCSIFILSGCQQGNAETDSSQTATASKTPAFIYENEKYHLYIPKHSTWKVDAESISDSLNIKLSHSEHLHAIVTTISEQTTFDMVKNDLLAGAGEIKNLSESSNRFSYESTLSDPIHTEVHFKKRSNHPHILIVVMTSAQTYEQNKSYIEEFINHIQ